jgi:hypothetical protein
MLVQPPGNTNLGHYPIMMIIINIPSSHSINAIGPAPVRSGNKREHCSRMLATIAHIPILEPKTQQCS